MVTVFPAWTRPKAIFWPTTMTMPVFDARRCTVTGSVRGCGGGPAGRAPRSLPIWAAVNGLGRVRRSSRVSGSKNDRVCASIRIATARPPRISAARTMC